MLAVTVTLVTLGLGLGKTKYLYFFLLPISVTSAILGIYWICVRKLNRFEIYQINDVCTSECRTVDTGEQITGSLLGTSHLELRGRCSVNLSSTTMCMNIVFQYTYRQCRRSLSLFQQLSVAGVRLQCMSVPPWVLLGSFSVLLGPSHRLVLLQSFRCQVLSKVDQSSPPSPSCINLASLTTCSN